MTNVPTTSALTRDLYAAFGSGDCDAAARLVRDDCILHVPGTGANAGEYWGRDGFRRFMGNILAYNGGVFDVQVPVVSIHDDDVFTREIVTLNRRVDPDRRWTLCFAMHYRWKAGGLSEAWVIPEDLRRYDEYWTLPVAAPELVTNGPSLVRSASPAVIDLQGASSAENLAALRRFYELFFRGEMAELESLVAKDVVVNITGRGDLSGIYRGWDGYLQFRHKLVAMIGSRYKLEIDAIAASERDGWVKEYIRMDRVWDRAITPIHVIMHFDLDGGKVVAMDDFPLDQYAWERAFTFPSHLHAPDGAAPARRP